MTGVCASMIDMIENDHDEEQTICQLDPTDHAEAATAAGMLRFRI